MSCFVDLSPELIFLLYPFQVSSDSGKYFQLLLCEVLARIHSDCCLMLQYKMVSWGTLQPHSNPAQGRLGVVFVDIMYSFFQGRWMLAQIFCWQLVMCLFCCSGLLILRKYVTVLPLRILQTINTDPRDSWLYILTSWSLNTVTYFSSAIWSVLNSALCILDTICTFVASSLMSYGSCFIWSAVTNVHLTYCSILQDVLSVGTQGLLLSLNFSHSDTSGLPQDTKAPVSHSPVLVSQFMTFHLRLPLIGMLTSTDTCWCVLLPSAAPPLGIGNPELHWD